MWILFVGSTFITQITFLNMLIAIMGDTFDRVSENKEQSGLKERIKILADYVIVVSRESQAEGTVHRFIFAISPTTVSTDESSSWEGTVTTLKKTINDSTSVIKQAMSKRISALSIEVTSAAARITGLDDKISELHGSQDRIN